MRKLVPEKTKRLLKSLILLGLNYCSIVWLFIRAFDKGKLEQINATPDARKYLRAAFNDSTLSYESNNVEKGNTTNFLYNRRLQDLAILIFLVKNGISPDYISGWAVSKIGHRYYNLRNSDIIIPRFNTISFGKHTIRQYLGPYLWRKLPIALKEN